MHKGSRLERQVVTSTTDAVDFVITCLHETSPGRASNAVHIITRRILDYQIFWKRWYTQQACWILFFSFLFWRTEYHTDSHPLLSVRWFSEQFVRCAVLAAYGTQGDRRTVKNGKNAYGLYVFTRMTIVCEWWPMSKLFDRGRGRCIQRSRLVSQSWQYDSTTQWKSARQLSHNMQLSPWGKAGSCRTIVELYQKLLEMRVLNASYYINNLSIPVPWIS